MLTKPGVFLVRNYNNDEGMSLETTAMRMTLGVCRLAVRQEVEQSFLDPSIPTAI